MIRYTVHFAGRVQGVGFRYTTVSVAGGFDVAGYVMNLEDGRVRLVAEGDAAERARFVVAVADRMSGYIRETKTDKSPATAEFGSAFTVRR